MTDRQPTIDAFLRECGWSDASRLDMAGDLSSRRYMRLVQPDGRTAVLMDAPPDLDSTTPAFIRMTEWLRDSDLSAPEILAHNHQTGLVLLEDLGQAKVSQISSDIRLRDLIYDDVLNLLIRLRHLDPPALSRPDAAQLVAMTRLADDHYPGIAPQALTGFRSVLETVLADLLGETATVSLRDFHADNMLWLPDRKGIRRIGLLDYQDAFLTHPVYDLVSLLTDARTDIPAPFRNRMMADYAHRTGDDPDRLSLAFAAFSAQRNLRILGIFARAAQQHGKTAHLSKLPRVHRHLADALSHPVFDGVRDEALTGIPAPQEQVPG